MRKRILDHLIVGLGIGFIATTLCLWIFKLNEASGAEVMRQFTTWLFASALYGLISLIYDSDIPFSVSLAIHFAGCTAITFAASCAAGFFEFMVWYEWFIYVLPVFIIMYIIIGASVTVITRCQAKKINGKLKK
ncbi:MAG: DUF3021 domain-containing protein [Clostridia bacterium]|nr:DUF3021 domain-containing protein [Clostridia bacterium]